MIKKVMISIALFMAFQMANSQSRELVIPSQIKEVTVFMTGAQVSRTGEITLEKGTWSLIFNQVSPQIDPQSIQLSNVSDVTLMSVKHRVDHLQEGVKGSGMIKDSIEKIDFMLAQVSNAMYVLNEEIQLLQANRKVGGDKGTDIATLEEMQDLYRKRLTSIKEDLLRLTIQEKKYRETKDRLQRQWNDENQLKEAGVHQVVATILCEARVTLRPLLTYFVQQAGWSPTYDIRVKDLNSPLKLVYKANVWQQTGEDWKQVMLTLSTGNPNLSGTKPNMASTYINLYEPKEIQAYGRKYKSAMKQEQEAPESYQLDGMTIQGNALTVKNTFNYSAVMQNNATSVIFKIPTPYTFISGNSSEQTIEAQHFEMKADYKGMTVPKLDPAVFWVATVTGREELNQLNGMANIYFQGVYTGQSAVNTIGEDSLLISLGRDKNYIVERKRVKEMTTKSIFGSSKKEVFVWEIMIRNTRNEAAELNIEDQIPLSRSEDVSIDLIDGAGAQYEAETGKLVWTPKLAAGETLKIRFSYSIKYPKGKQLLPH